MYDRCFHAPAYMFLLLFMVFPIIAPPPPQISYRPNHGKYTIRGAIISWGAVMGSPLYCQFLCKTYSLCAQLKKSYILAKPLCVNAFVSSCSCVCGGNRIQFILTDLAY